MDHANDNSKVRTLPTTFREKIVTYYEETGVMYPSASFIATYYLAAVQRSEQLDMDTGPILPGCEEFGAEPSPREIIEAHARRAGHENELFKLAELVDLGIEAARAEITRSSNDTLGYRRALFPSTFPATRARMFP